MIPKLINAFMKFFFHLLYHGLAFSYDLVAAIVSLGHWKDWIYDILPYLDRQPVVQPLVELGHGPGHLQNRLLDLGRYSIGLDESRQMSRLARQRLRQLPFRLLRADARHLPFPPRSIPLYVATFPSEYIFSADTLAEIFRTLTDTGKVAILLAAWPGGDSLPEKAVRMLFRVTGESPPDSFPYARLVEKFTRQGFKTEIKVDSFQNTRLLVIILTK